MYYDIETPEVLYDDEDTLKEHLEESEIYFTEEGLTQLFERRISEFTTMSEHLAMYGLEQEDIEYK